MDKKRMRWKLRVPRNWRASFGFLYSGINWSHQNRSLVLLSAVVVAVLFSFAVTSVEGLADKPYSINLILGEDFKSNISGAPFDHHLIDCRQLQIGQYRCPPKVIDEVTQQPAGCGPHNLAPLDCDLKVGLACDAESANVPGGRFGQVRLAVQCEYTNGYSFEAALLLSIFLGMFGLDRLYLGYPAIALLKFCTLGFFFLGQFVDIILIALQVLGPADGSNYINKAYGARMNIIRSVAQAGLTRPVALDPIHGSAFDLYFYPDNVTFTDAD